MQEKFKDKTDEIQQSYKSVAKSSSLENPWKTSVYQRTKPYDHPVIEILEDWPPIEASILELRRSSKSKIQSMPMFLW